MEAKELERVVACAELRNPKVFNASRERYVAEISFKAGYGAGYDKGHSDLFHKDAIVVGSFNPRAKPSGEAKALFDAYEKGKSEGRKEVVEWLEGNAYYCPEVDYEKWQAKLKEWGISL